jgi:hypothetical protein
MWGWSVRLTAFATICCAWLTRNFLAANHLIAALYWIRL